jgi:hypothetical protein
MAISRLRSRLQHQQPQPATSGQEIAPREIEYAPGRGGKPPSKIRMWDVVERRWTLPNEPELVYGLYLKKEVIKCSACNFTTVYNQGSFSVSSHIKKVYESAKYHKGARIVDARDRDGQRCTGCDAPFSSRKRQGDLHLKTTLMLSDTHHHAHPLVTKRFSLEVSEPVGTEGPRLVSNGVVGSDIRDLGPQVDQSGASRTRKRRRRRRR